MYFYHLSTKLHNKIAVKHLLTSTKKRIFILLFLYSRFKGSAGQMPLSPPTLLPGFKNSMSLVIQKNIMNIPPPIGGTEPP